MLLKLTILYIVVTFVNSDSNENNVCKTLFSYINIKSDSKNCYYNPNVNASTKEILERYGYTHEEYYLTTEDGYMVKLDRLGSKKNNSKDRHPVILQPGIGGAPQFWILRGEDGLAFQLFENGYDVWLPSIRGTFPESKDEKFEKNNSRYWNFSFHEVAIYDIPAITEFISKTIGNKTKIIYIGHSMGTTISYIYASAKREHAEKYLQGIVSIAPVAYLTHAELALRLIAPFDPVISTTLKVFGLYAIGQPGLLKNIMTWACSRFPTILICDAFNGRWIGTPAKQERMDLLPVYFSFYPRPTPVKTLIHYLQIANSGQFQRYNYGIFGNSNRYNHIFPPKYNLSDITLPVHFFVGLSDNVATLQDNDRLRRKLHSNGVVTTRHIYEGYGHNDFFLGKEYNTFSEDLINVVDHLSKQ